MRFLFPLLLLWSSTALAEISREEASKTIDEMVKANMISEEEAKKAKVRLRSMSANEWSALNHEAENKAVAVSRSPASVSVADPERTDLSREQFAAIEQDLKAIAPHINVP